MRSRRQAAPQGVRPDLVRWRFGLDPDTPDTFKAWEIPDRPEELRVDGAIRASAARSGPLASAVRAAGMPTLVTEPRRPGNPIVFVNDAFHQPTGFTRKGRLARNCVFLQGPETDPATVAHIREAIDRCHAITF